MREEEETGDPMIQSENKRRAWAIYAGVVIMWHALYTIAVGSSPWRWLILLNMPFGLILAFNSKVDL